MLLLQTCAVFSALRLTQIFGLLSFPQPTLLLPLFSSRTAITTSSLLAQSARRPPPQSPAFKQTKQIKTKQANNHGLEARSWSSPPQGLCKSISPRRPATSQAPRAIFRVSVALTTSKTQSFWNPPPAPLPPGPSTNPFAGALHNTTGPATNRSRSPLPYPWARTGTSAPSTGPLPGTTTGGGAHGHHVPPPVPRPAQDQSHIERVQLSIRHIDDDVVFIHRQVDDLLCDPNLAPVREAGRRIAMASRLLRWNFERLLALNEAVKEENAKLKDEVRAR